MKKILLVTILIILFLAPVIVLGAGLGNAKGIFTTVAGNGQTSSNGDIQSVLGIGMRVALTLVGLIFLILMVYAGYLWMTARGEEEQIKKAQKIITSTMIGVVIIMSAWAITFFIVTRFEGA